MATMVNTPAICHHVSTPGSTSHLCLQNVGSGFGLQTVCDVINHARFFSLCFLSKQVNVKQSSRVKLCTDIRQSEAGTFNFRNKR